jgi:hypothetical protein
MEYREAVQKHYESVWDNEGENKYWYKGPIQKLDPDFSILEFAPSTKRQMYTYATCCMSNKDDESPIELHMFSSTQDHTLVELLTAVAHYHKNSNKLYLHHTVNFGRPWQDQSECEYGFISLPYLDGPDLENLTIQDFKKNGKCYWLVPISKVELEFKKNYGVEALEERFDVVGLNYLNPKRSSVV